MESENSSSDDDDRHDEAEDVQEIGNSSPEEAEDGQEEEEEEDFTKLQHRIALVQRTIQKLYPTVAGHPGRQLKEVREQLEQVLDKMRWEMAPRAEVEEFCLGEIRDFLRYIGHVYVPPNADFYWQGLLFCSFITEFRIKGREGTIRIRRKICFLDCCVLRSLKIVSYVRSRIQQ